MSVEKEKEDRPNWAGYAWGASKKEPSQSNKDDELRTARADSSWNPDPNFIVGGPTVKKTVVSEPRSSVD